ncbi:MAG: cell division FtsZ family protein, partial [Deltaproteobacteria bacterium]|nr:cell division FtsZ family protein [Deltaproteobacteria bacterium]
MSDDFSFVKNNGGLDACGSNHVIKVVGIGGCGNKAVNHMINQGLNGPEYVGLNTDPQDLDNCLATTKILIGEKTTKRRGCGGNPEKGRLASEESVEKIKEALNGTDMLFIAAGMGGGTGSGGAAVIARAMSELDPRPLIVAFVTTPFDFEKQHRKTVAAQSIKTLTPFCNSVITVSNAKLQSTAPKGTTMLQGQAMANDILYRGVAGIIEILTKPGTINNLDFEDIQQALSVQGPGLIGLGDAQGEDRAKKAFKNAISSPLMANSSLKGAKRILVNLTGDENLLLEEYVLVSELATAEVKDDCEVFTGTVTDNSLMADGSVRVTVIATGIMDDGGDGKLWDSPSKDELEKLGEEVITLDTYAEEPEVMVRPERENVPNITITPPAARPPMQVHAPLGEARKDGSQGYAPPQNQRPNLALQAGVKPVPKRPTKYESNL